MCTWPQPQLHTVAASAAYGCRLPRIRLQPLTHAVAASLTYGCSLFHIRLQLFEATVKGLPLVCVNVVGGGYDFGTAKPMLLDLGAALPQAVI